ncbi:SCO family protein [Rhodobacterales bacterium 52_120_T64]|nr:SCO family protein [Rhodobacterales bacterium 52_120_T64]
MSRFFAIIAVLVVLSGLGTALLLILRPASADQFAACRSTAVAGGSAAIGGPFELTDHNDRRVTDVDVIDRPTLMYFGYTFCPDVCPLDTYRNAEAVALLGERGVDVKPVMVTIDPARDTSEALAAFVGYLHEDMVGLTGTTEEIAAAIKAYRVYAAKNGEGENYLMDHSTWTYLMAPEHGFLEFFGRDTSPEDMADQVACFVDKL